MLVVVTCPKLAAASNRMDRPRNITALNPDLRTRIFLTSSPLKALYRVPHCDTMYRNCDLPKKSPARPGGGCARPRLPDFADCLDTCHASAPNAYLIHATAPWLLPGS